MGLDTLGQDRNFTPEQQEFALTTIADFRDDWNSIEISNLKADRKLLMELQLRDKAWQEKEAAKYQEDEEYYVQEKMIVREENETPET